MPLGRRDAEAFDPQTCVDFENLDIATLKQKFDTMGLNVQEFVALSGAHTIGLPRMLNDVLMSTGALVRCWKALTRS